MVECSGGAAPPQPGQPPQPSQQQPEAASKPADPYNLFEGPLSQLVEHTKKIDVEEENRRYLEKSGELWESLEESGWWQDSKESVKA